MSKRRGFPLVDNSNEKLNRRKMKALRYVNFEITLVAFNIFKF